MSWAVEEWKDGLPGKALQKIQEMEGQLDKLKKERSQKLFQMESLEAALLKQKQKVDSERNEISAMKRENQSLLESCDSLEKARQKVVHDLGVKEQQVNYLEGQLNAFKKTIERLEQELKKYKTEIDRSQPAGNSSAASSSDLPVFATPQKGFATPAPVHTFRQQDNRLEDLQEKCNQEMEEGKRLENELKILQVKLLNQSSVSVSHKDIASRQQAGSSIFPWQQQEQSHSRHTQDAMETPLKRRGASLWDLHDETPIKSSQRLSYAVASPSGSSQQMDQLKAQNQEFRSRVSELERNLANQEKEIKSQTSKLQELQTQLTHTRKDLSDRDKDLAKKSHELTQATDKHQQLQSKCTTVEQKLKQVTEEMNCQRHNAESCKRALEQKLKDLERDSQKELAQLQNTHQTLERQMNQTQTKLTQEVQLSKKDHNMLQSDIEKLNFQKSHLEKEVEEHKQKLLRSEQSLQACQTKEQDLHKKVEELQREKNYASVQLDQSTRRLNQLEDEKKSSDQSLKRSQGLLDDLRAKSEGQTDELKRLQSKLDQQTHDLDDMKRTLSEAETTNSKSQSDLLKQKRECEQVTNKLIILEKDCQELNSSLVVCQNECAELKQAHEALLQWKNEKETLVNDTEAVQNGLKEQLSSSENNVNMLNEVNEELKKRQSVAEEMHRSLSAQIDSLKGELLNKCTELEEREHQHKELESKLSEAELKHSKDLKNVGAQVMQLENQVKDIQMCLQKEEARAEQAERRITQLQEEQEATFDLITSKDQLVELGRAEINQLRESLSLATAQQEEQVTRVAEEKASLLKRCEESVLLKETESEELKLSVQEAQQELLLAQNKISSMDQFMRVQEQLGEDLHKQIKTLSETAEQHKKMLKDQTDEAEQIKQELKDLKRQTEEKDKLHKETADQMVSLVKQKVELENSIRELKKEMAIFNNVTAEKIKALHGDISLLEERVAEGRHAADRLPVLEDELNRVNQAHTDLKLCLEALERNHSSVTEIKSNLENTLVEKNALISSLELNIKDLTEKLNTQSENHASELEHFLNEERKVKDQLEQLSHREVAIKTELRSRREEIKTMKATISAASSGLQERDNKITTLNEKLKTVEAEQCKSAELLKEKMDAMNKIKVQLEMLQMDLEDNETVMNQMEELKGTTESLEAQLAYTNTQMCVMEARLEDSKAQVSVLETRLEEVQAQNTSLEAQYVTAREELMDRSFEITRLEEDAAQRKQLEEAVADLQSELDGIRVENEKLETKLKLTIEHRDKLVTEKSNLEDNLIQGDVEKKDLKDSINHLTEENRRLQGRVEELQEKTYNALDTNSELSEEMESLGNDQLRLQLKYLLENCDAFHREKTQDLVKSIASSQKELFQTKIENEKLQTNVRLTTERINLLTEENGQLQNKIEQLGQLEAEVNEVISEMELHKDVQEKDLFVNNPLEQTPSSSQQEVEKLQEELDRRVRKNEEDLKEKDKLFEVEQARLLTKLTGLQREFSDFKQKYNLLQEQVNRQHDFIVQLSDAKTSESPAEACSPKECTEIEIDEEIPLGKLHVVEETSLETREDGLEVDPKSHFSGKTLSDIMPQECLQNVCANIEERVTGDLPPKDDNVLAKISNESHLVHEDMKCTEMPNTIQFSGAAGAHDDKLQTLHSEIDLLNADLELRKEMSAETETYVKNLEQKMTGMEAKSQEAINKLNIASKENKVLVNQVGKLTEDNESLMLQLQTAKCQLTDIMEMLEGLEMAKGGWDERFLQQESELKRVRSEKANLEQHILGMEGELETLQEEGIKLKQELDNQRRVCSGMENSVERHMAETTQLRSELVSCTEERDDLSQALFRCKEQVHSLEKTNSDTRELISILEEDIRAKKKEYVLLQNNMEKIKTEREQFMEQVKTLEQTLDQQNGEKDELIDQLEKIQEDHTSDINNTESLATKIQSLEGEVSRLTHSLESSLLEKGEIASRLNSTQDEVQQMRTGIEKLQVRIEADERKKKKLGELLKAAQRKADVLQNRIDALEREKEDSEQSLEDAVIQVESVKVELEEEIIKVEEEKKELSEKLKELSTELDHLKMEKESMEQELVMKRQEIEALKAAKDELERGLERVQIDRQQEVQLLERVLKEATEKQTKEVGDLQTQLEDLQTKILHLEQKSTALEAEKIQMQSVLLESENEKKQLSSSLKEWQMEGRRLQTEEEQWDSEKQNFNTRIGIFEKETEKLKSLIAAKDEEQTALGVTRRQEEDHKQTLEKSIAALTKEKEVIEDQNRQVKEEKEHLESALVLVQRQRDELESTLASVKEENENLCSNFALMEKNKGATENSLSLFEQHKVKLDQEKQTLELEMQKCQSLNGLLKEEKNELNIKISLLEEEMKRIEEAKEKLQYEKEQLQSSMEKELELNKVSISELNDQVSELTSRVARIAKEKDSALSKINLFMKTCKQLEEEKQVLMNNAESDYGSEEVIQLKMAAEEKEKRVQSLEASLEVKTSEAQQSNKNLEQVSSALDLMKEECDTKNKELEMAKIELIHLNQVVEDKSQEADESMDKYCTLMIQVHKLEETNNALTARLEQINNKQNTNANIHPSGADGLRRSSRKSSSRLHSTENSENIPSAPLRSPLGPAKRGHCDVTDKDAAQEALHSLTKKIKATAANTPKPQAPQDEDFRPEGLPELVQKGFADIPLGEASPFIVRRTTVRRCSPRLMSKQIPTSPETDRVLEPLNLQSPADDGALNRKRLSQSAKDQKTNQNVQKTTEQTQAQGENCHVQ
ncbi:uncharacterized protein cenpf [Eucyclogobius newberryi]|uniref:uncharacterized protein cenpf n=1 Tax=Eucyclogobius newberryi TaxID=166745 RepID=UPI003B5CB1FF